MLQVSVSDFPLASTTLTVKLEVPAVVGVPEITPVEVFSVSPAGSVPEVSENLNGAVPPVTFMAAEYAVPAVALPAEQGPQSRFTGEPTTSMVQIAVSDFPFESTTFEVNW